MSECRTCGAQIIFGQTSKSPIPLNAKSRKVAVFRKGTNFVDIVDGFDCHFATCPQADEHRKGKRLIERGGIIPVDDGRIDRGAE
jgi:hypothetical protein